jgi:phosphoribosylaminoimidazolecarboxamide formyltransferase/IMP cyclohydrolase
LQGKELSYNNINDTDAAYEAVSNSTPRTAACVIVKHANPCGVAEGADLASAYRKALACDSFLPWRHHRVQPQARCGRGDAVAGIFTEVIIAPDATAKRSSSASARTCGCWPAACLIRALQA